MKKLPISNNNNIEIINYNGYDVLFKDTRITYSLLKITYFGIVLYSSIEIGEFGVDHTGRLLIAGVDEL